MKETILAVMMLVKAWKGDADETAEQRRALYAPTATAIAIVAQESADPVRAASILLALFENESMGARYVLEGRCGDGPKAMRCDWSKRLRRPMARGPFQVHGWCRGAWDAEDGSFESILGGARCALHYVNKGLRRCHGWAGTFSVYRGQACSAGAKVGKDYKGQKYARSRVLAERRLEAIEEGRSRSFHDYLRSQYQTEEEVSRIEDDADH